MMDHKTRLNMGAKGQVMLMIAAIGTDKKMELVNKYQDSTKKLLNKNDHCMMVGSCLNITARLITRGATEQEVNSSVEHLQVLIMAGKYPMNIRRSFEDHNLSDIYAKYFSSEDPKDILEKRRKLVEERERIRKERKEKISNMLDSGCTMEYIAEELMLPESTVRHLADHLNDDK